MWATAQARNALAAFFLILGPFFFPEQLWFLIFFFPLPFLLATAQKQYAFSTFYFWSLLLISIQSYGFLLGIFHLSSGPFIARLLPPLLLVGIYALYPAILFGLTQIGLRLVGSSCSLLVRLFVWTLSLWLTFLLLIQAGLWFTGSCEGYPLINPLLPLATQPGVLAYVVPALGTELTLLLLLSFSVPMAYAILAKNKTALLFTGILALPWLLSWAHAQAESQAIDAETCTLIKELRVVPGTWASFCKNAQELPKQTHYLLFPESACEEPFALGHLCDFAAQHPHCHIITGGFRDDHNTHRNTAFWLHETIQGFYDKRHAMPLTERIPPVCNFSMLRQAYFHTIAEVVPAHAPRPCWHLSDNVAVVPYICSELFFFSNPDDPYHDPIVALCYDSWPAAAYARQLLLLTARYKAIAWQRDIIYAGYEFQALCTKKGQFYSLCTP